MIGAVVLAAALCRPPLLCEPEVPKAAPVVETSTEPCTSAGVCCRWVGFIPKLRCGWHWDCPGKRSVTFVDGKRTGEGACR